MPKNSIQGINAPLVTDRKEGPSEWDEFDTYLIERGQADICFPTDFNFLRHAASEVFDKTATVMKNNEFFDEYALSSWAECRNGYNPLREEYVNTSFLLV